MKITPKITPKRQHPPKGPPKIRLTEKAGFYQATTNGWTCFGRTPAEALAKLKFWSRTSVAAARTLRPPRDKQ
jgi:hypothetical protein